jgi:hypothetical protein
VNGRPVPVRSALAAEDAGDLPVGVVFGESADQLDRVLGGPALLQ